MSNNILADLQPHAVFKYFEQICAIPHGSGNVKQISDYLCEFARERNLWFKQDESYNVIIKKPASNSESKAAPVILQGHIDMVRNTGGKLILLSWTMLKIWKKMVLTFI